MLSAIADQWFLGAACGAVVAAILLGFAMWKAAAGRQKRVALLQVVLLLLSVALLFASAVRWPAGAGGRDEPAPGWQSTGRGITEGISGLALVSAKGGNTTFLAVHDNKRAGEKRLSLIERITSESVQTRPLTWTAEPLPVDLEAICKIPGSDARFLALTSKGALYRFDYDVATGALAFDATPAGVPNAAEERQFESLDVQQVGGQTFACWAERGDGGSPGLVFCSIFDPAAATFGEPQSLEVRAPWPEAHTRHISDLRLLSDGTILAVSASDPGDEGPFASAVYVAGTLHPAADRPQLLPAQPFVRLSTTSRHKIEAIELVPGTDGGLVLGSDDENLGAAVLFSW